VTYAIGARLSEKTLSRFVSERRFKRFQTRMKSIGPLTMGLSAAAPPPFPLTAFVLSSGALRVPLARFLIVFAAARLVRFGTEAVLARRFGTSLLRMLESDAAQQVVIALIVASIAGTVFTIVRIWRHT
jgi:membrane protein YqaA with SNARE-associated domain